MRWTAVTVVLLCACSAETGGTAAAGPAGPRGEPGPPGERGPQGPPGPPGMDAVAAGGLEVLTFEGECDVEHTQRLQINDASPEHWRRTWTSDVDTDGTPVSRIALAAFSACDWEEWGPPSGGCDDYPTATVCAEAGDGVVADQFDCVFGSPTVSDGQARVVCGSEFDVGTVLRGSKADRVTVRLWVTSP